MDIVWKILPSASTIALVIVALFVAQRLLDKSSAAAAGRSWRNQLIMLGLSTLGLVVVVLVVPIGDSTRGQLLALIGILLSATIALSSTTVLGNAMAGLMLRAVRSFHIGDFVRTGDHFGRVTERGLFHTEIQTADRELTTLPNLYLVTHPVTKLRNSGTVISATVSLGYDVARTRVSDLLLEAAGRTGLRDPFVQILELGDFSVTYRIAGVLEEIKQILTTHSRLRADVMDALHDGGIEIVSPTFMNQRPLRDGHAFIPAPSYTAAPELPASAPEEVVFDKADEAESIEALRASRDQLVEQLKSAKEQVDKTPKGPERDRAQTGMAALQARRERLDKIIAAREAKVAESE